MFSELETFHAVAINSRVGLLKRNRNEAIKYCTTNAPKLYKIDEKAEHGERILEICTS